MRKKRILLVDDDVNTSELMRMTLEHDGDYEVRVINQGKQALSVMLEFRPDLVCLDLVMPDMQGQDIASGMKEDGMLKHIPVIFMTGMVTRDEAQSRGGMLSGYPVLAKPVEAEEFIQFIRKTLLCLGCTAFFGRLSNYSADIFNYIICSINQVGFNIRAVFICFDHRHKMVVYHEAGNSLS